jgi:hypothetical protein
MERHIEAFNTLVNMRLARWCSFMLVAGVVNLHSLMRGGLWYWLVIGTLVVTLAHMNLIFWGKRRLVRVVRSGLMSEGEFKKARGIYLGSGVGVFLVGISGLTGFPGAWWPLIGGLQGIAMALALEVAVRFLLTMN